MAHTVVWSPRAIDDVEAIAAYIAEDSKVLRRVGSARYFSEGQKAF